MAYAKNIQNLSKMSHDNAICMAGSDINSAQTPTGENLLPLPVAHWLAEINRRVQALSKAQQQKQAE